MLGDGRLAAAGFGHSARVSEDALEAWIRRHSQVAAVPYRALIDETNRKPRSGPLGAARVGRLPSCPDRWPSMDSVMAGPTRQARRPTGVRIVTDCW